ncbi:7d41f91f-9536-4217-902d-2411a86e2008 [Thermothielavioides terrestris]|uniref:7d41f91f-9536-4217-902d-2411a86e2008 n=1 Tax=Thermothielavioides terrestris TaxID=2587410 RepID=A0A446B781_9PEZI|nr:7d41f91f-9536-4217-902d-2411a86e2008 [Thermothielavioides terrestris]
MSPPFRIPIPVPFPVPVPVPATLQVADTSISQRRDASGKPNPHQVQIILSVFAGIAGAVILAFIARHVYRRRFRSAHAYQPALREEDGPFTRQINRANQDNLEDALNDAQAQTSGTNGSTTDGAGIDRNTSIRSVMTLPAYRPKATENELVLGREGERDGIDVVVEMRTAEEEEALRDEEMEALYRIREARRRQLAEREERRQQRREAREANDLVALRELRQRARERAAQNEAEIDELRQEHERIRQTRHHRAVSSVSYADVGIARADGTRVRANSTESTERVGLLSDAASIAADSLFQRRDRSASASLSIDTARSLQDRPDSPGVLATGGSGAYSLASAGRTRSRTNSGATTPRIPTPSAATTPRAGSSPELIDAEDADLGDAGMPPPGYDEVSLDDVTPLHSRRNSDVSGRASPYPDPPPEYPGPGPGPAERRNNRLSAHMGDLAAQAQGQGGGDGDGNGGRSGVPRLPSLRLSQVPQIVIEPSSALP